MANSSNCNEFIELLDAYIDDELEDGERIATEAHLAGCAACAQEVKSIRRLAGELKSLQKLPARREIDFSFMDGVQPVPLDREDCVEFVELLDGYYDQELDATELHKVDVHLAECANCTTQLAGIGKVALGLKSLKKVAPSRDIVGSLNFERGQGARAPGKSDCANIIPLLDAFYDQELADHEKTAVGEHLRRCDDCSDQLRSIELLVDRIKTLPRLLPTRDIVGSIDIPAIGTSNSNVLNFPSVKTKSARRPFDRKIQIGACTAAAAAVALIFCINFKSASTVPGEQIASNTSNPTMTKTFASSDQGNESESQSVNGVPLINVPSSDVSANNTPLNNGVAKNVSASSGAVIGVTANNRPVNKLGSQGMGSTSVNQQEHQVAGQSNASSKSVVKVEEIAARNHEVLPNDSIGNSDSANEVAAIPDSSSAVGADALGIATDEDGLYDIKI